MVKTTRCAHPPSPKVITCPYLKWSIFHWTSPFTNVPMKTKRDATPSGSFGQFEPSRPMWFLIANFIKIWIAPRIMSIKKQGCKLHLHLANRTEFWHTFCHIISLLSSEVPASFWYKYTSVYHFPPLRINTVETFQVNVSKDGHRYNNANFKK